VGKRIDLRILVLHPKHWADRRMWPEGVQVRHVEIGGDVPRRASGRVSYDGIGQCATEEGKEKLVDTVRSWGPHVLLYGIHHGLHSPTLKLIRTVSPDTKFVHFYTDQRPTISKFVREFLGLTDMIMVSNRDSKDHAMYAGEVPLIRAFYDGVCPKEYWPKPAKPTCDCFFGGNNFWLLWKEMVAKKINTAPWIGKFSGAKFRDEFLREVGERFELEIRGEWGWNEFPHEVGKPVFHPWYNDTLRGARIVLNTINLPRKGLLTRRFFRSMATGRLFMTQYTPGLEETFANHRHLVWFKGLEEGLDMIRFYLDHETERERIAAAGRREIIKRHTWRHRLAEFVEIVKGAF
jgi:hypothetical protein